MKFKVGDKVRLTRELTKADLAEVEIKFCADQVIKELGCNIFEVKDISEKNLRICISLPSDNWLLKSEWFELAEQPKPIESQVDDVWASADKSSVVKVVGKFKTDAGEEIFNYVHLKDLGIVKKGMVSSRLKFDFFERFPVLLHRPQKPKKQPKTAKNQPKKREEEKWYKVGCFNIDGEVYRSGNSIKWVCPDGTEGIATCNKHDVFSLNFGIDLAWHRAEIKRHTKELNAMLGKEEGK